MKTRKLLSIGLITALLFAFTAPAAAAAESKERARVALPGETRQDKEFSEIEKGNFEDYLPGSPGHMPEKKTTQMPSH